MGWVELEAAVVVTGPVTSELSEVVSTRLCRSVNTRISTSFQTQNNSLSRHPLPTKCPKHFRLKNTSYDKFCKYIYVSCHLCIYVCILTRQGYMFCNKHYNVNIWIPMMDPLKVSKTLLNFIFRIQLFLQMHWSVRFFLNSVNWYLPFLSLWKPESTESYIQVKV